MSVTYHDDMVQGSPEWLAFRKVFITGTDALDLLRGKDIDDILESKQANSSFKGNRATRRGHRLEPEAVELLEAIKELTVHHTGFITNSKFPMVGYSPDGLIAKDGLVECKAFNKERHLANGKRPEITIISQIQWGLFVSERKYAYLVLYNPDLDPEQAIIIIHIARDEKVMKRFRALLRGKQ